MEITMIIPVLVSLLQINQLPTDPLQLLRETFDQRETANVSLVVSLNREEVLPGTKTKQTHLKLSYCKFGDREFCALSRDENGSKYSYKLCKGCYDLDKDRVLISTTDNAEFFIAKSSKEAMDTRMMFDLRLLGFYSFVPEGVDSNYTRTYLLDIYEKPRINEKLSDGNVICIELSSKPKTALLRYFINTKLKRLEKMTLNNSEINCDVTVQSLYNSEANFFPSKIKKTTSQGEYRLTEEIDVLEARRLTKLDDVNWGPDLVDFRRNIFVASTTLQQKKPVQDVLFYDGKSIREPTKKDFDKYGKKVEPINSLPDDNSRRNGQSFLYLIPIAFFVGAIVLLLRLWWTKSKSRTSNAP
jgi:hypothetical protein